MASPEVQLTSEFDTNPNNSISEYRSWLNTSGFVNLGLDFLGGSDCFFPLPASG